ncbi:MAG: TrmB family transcriptional regulator [Ignavibacteriae bacterium]|nr:MAG: TrmB family transcriptional regulator [Ignavibacteriota bacterium]
MNEEIVQNIESLGFTNYEAKVFCALFNGSFMTTTEIAGEAKIPRSSAYEILKSFTKKGICNEILTSSVVRYELIDPKVVEDKMEKDINDDFRSKISKLKYSFDKLEPLFRAREAEAEKVDVELIKGFNKHRHSKFLNLLKEAEKEVLFMIRLEGNISPELDEAVSNLYKKGGIVRSIYEASYNFRVKTPEGWKKVDEAGLVDIVKKFESFGEQVHIADKIYQSFMVIIDRKIVYVSLVDPTIPKYNRSDVIMNNENYALSMAEYFETCWNKSKTIEEFEKNIIKIANENQ